MKEEVRTFSKKTIAMFIVSMMLILVLTGYVILAKGDPSAPPWDVVYPADWELPTDADPPWTLATATGTHSYSISSEGDLLQVNVSRTGSGGSSSLVWTRTESVNLDDGFTFEVKANVTNWQGTNQQINNADCSAGIWITIGANTHKIRVTFWNQTEVRLYVETLTKAVTVDADQFVSARVTISTSANRGTIEVKIYVDGTEEGTIIYPLGTDHSGSGLMRLSCTATRSVTGTDTWIDWDVDYFAYAFTDDLQTSSDLQDQIDDLEDQIDDLESRIRDLEENRYGINEQKGLGSPVSPKSPLAYFPRTRGDSFETIDPDQTIYYTNFENGTGTSISLYKPVDENLASTDYQIFSDEIHLSGTWTELWVNDTDGNVLYDTTEPWTYIDLVGDDHGGKNITVETSGGSNVRADRVTRLMKVLTFTWTKDQNTGQYTATGTIENDRSYQWRDVVSSWAFPEDVDIDIGSVKVYDLDNAVYLERGKEYAVTTGEVVVGLASLDSGSTRRFALEFLQRERYQDTIFFTVRDGDVIADTSGTYPDSPYKITLRHTQTEASMFEGTIIIKFDFQGSHKGEILDPDTIKVFIDDTYEREYVQYDTVSNEMRIYQQSFDAGHQAEIIIYADLKDRESPAIQLLMAHVVAIFIIGAILLAHGIFTIGKDIPKRKRWVPRVTLTVGSLLILTSILMMIWT